MTKTAKVDRRSRTDLDLFILAFARYGATTPYELRMVGGLSSGATLPALDRLVKAGHLKRGRKGSRGRREYAITVAGNHLLDRNSKSVLKDKSIKEFDVVLRTAALALLLDHRPESVAAFLRATAKAWPKVPAPKPVNIEVAWKAEFYRHMKQVADSITLNCQVEIFMNLAARIMKKN
jgi:DNA-binding PadR family transcriptional regulator